MAIDGVKIIDSDSGYDIYNDITERYKDGEDIEKIRQDWLNEEDNFCIDELFTEIYWTAFAYSLWKIGYKEPVHCGTRFIPKPDNKGRRLSRN